MSAPYYPGARPPFGGELQEILRRLDLMERKIDWIAQRVVKPAQSPAPATASDSRSHPKPVSAESSETAGQDAATAVDERTEHAPAQQAAAKAPDQPEAVRRPPAIPPQAAVPPTVPPTVSPTLQRPVLAPQARPQTAHSGTPKPGAYGAYGTYGRPADAHQPHHQPQPPAGTSSAWNRIRSEGNVGRYLLSGAAALLVVLAAVSLIALVWDRIPDLVKIGLLGLIAAGLLTSGTLVSKRATRQRVAAATLTGTGGALGFVAIIGSVLLNTGVPVLLAFALMAAWAIVLLVTARTTSQIFTAVVSGLGTLITIGFASWHTTEHPETVAFTWTLVCLDVLALAAITAYLARSSTSMRLAPWFPVTAVPATIMTAAFTPVGALAPAYEPLCVILVFLPAVLIGIQVMDAGPRLYRSGWRWAAGLDWSLVGLVVLIAQCRLVGARAGGESVAVLVNAGAAGAPLLIGVIGAVLLVKPLSHAWRGQVAPVHLAVGILVGLLSSWSEIRMFPLVVIGLIAAAAPCARLLHSAAVPVVSGFGVVVLLGLVHQADVMSQACALAGLVLTPVGAVVLEQLLERAPLPQEDAGIPWKNHDQELAARRVSLSWASWILAADLVVLAPVLISRIWPHLHIGMLAAGVIAIVLARLGLASPTPTPRTLFTGALVGQRAGARGATPVTTEPPPAIWSGYASLFLVALAGLAVATPLSSMLWQTLLVIVALSVMTTAIWLLWPWLCRPLETIVAAAPMSVVLWWSIWILLGARMTGALVSVMVLATGAMCIAVGFSLRVTALRHYGLVLVLASVIKLAVMDIGSQNSVTRIIALGIAGLICFGLSLAYNRIAADDNKDANASPPSQSEPSAAPSSYGRPAPQAVPSSGGYTYGYQGSDPADDRRFQPPQQG